MVRCAFGAPLPDWLQDAMLRTDFEITIKLDLHDAEGQSVRQKAKAYFGIELSEVRTIRVVTIDASLSFDQLEVIRREVFTNPVTQISSYDPLPVDSDWVIWIGLRPGVKDNAGATAREAIEDILGIRLAPDEAVYTSKRYCLKGKELDLKAMEKIAGSLLANDIIQQWKIFSRNTWDPRNGVGIILPRVVLNHRPTVASLPIATNEILQKISDERNLALNPNDIPVIRAYFLDPKVLAERKKVGLGDPTDVELEYISQARSDHCNHNTFQGRFYYRDLETGHTEVADNLFKTCIKEPTLALQQKKDWVVSVLWDNAGAGRFDEGHYYVITGETHNSPSNMEAYGGAITGIVGVYRDPMGTGLGSKLIMGSYGFCTGLRDYDGPLKPRLTPAACWTA